MKRILLLTFVLLGVAVQSVAQRVDLNNVKFITVTTDKVNMRKAPNTSSAKLMMESLDGAEGCDSRAYPVWSDSRKSSGYSRCTAYPTNYSAYPVVGETKDWYKVLYWDFVEGCFEVWISKQFCHELSLAYWNAPGSYTRVNCTPYEGWIIMDNSDPENGDEYIMGHVVNKMMVFSKSCTEKLVDLRNCDMDNLTRAQIEEFFQPRSKKLVMYNAGGRSGSFEID